MAIVAPAGRPALVDAGWLSGDLFTTGLWFARSTDERIALLNNYWHHLQRSAGSAGLRSTPAYRRLLADMDGWWRWKQSYDDAILRRAASAFAQLWGGGLQSQYERELGAWKDRFVADLEELLAVSPPTMTDDLIARGVDPDLQLREFPSPEGGDGSIWVGLGVVVALVGFGAWSSYRTRPAAAAARPAAAAPAPAAGAAGSSGTWVGLAAIAALVGVGAWIRKDVSL